MRYVMHGGYVTSKSDGDVHFVTSRVLANLYGLKWNSPNVVDYHSPNYTARPGDIVLYPSYSGIYRLPKQE